MTEKRKKTKEPEPQAAPSAAEAPIDPWKGKDDGAEFRYINSVNKLSIGRGTRLTASDPKTGEIKAGTVAWDNRDGMIFVKFDDEEHPRGPFDPNTFEFEPENQV